jgi:hypothetical protein
MVIDKKLDYSAHELQAKHLLKQAHDLLLKGQWKEAASTIENTIVELRLMRNAVKSHIKE